MKTKAQILSIVPMEVASRRRTDLHLARKVWHCCMGLFILAVYHLSGMSRATGVMILGSFLAAFLTLETIRLNVPSFNTVALRFWKPLMRENEINRMSGVPYYIAACVLAIGVFPEPVATLCILYLAFGDPVASLIGILYGDRSIRFANGRSLIGTLASVTVCFLITLFYFSGFPFGSETILAVSLLGGIAGGTAELLPLEVDDNFTIPVVSGIVLWGVMIAFGI